VEGGASPALTAQYQCAILIADGVSKWYKVGGV
jgi:hypothetical protein